MNEVGAGGIVVIKARHAIWRKWGGVSEGEL
jgi:hypothetical protein